MKTRPISALDDMAYTFLVIISCGGYWFARVLLTRAIALAFEGVEFEASNKKGRQTQTGGPKSGAPLAKATPVATLKPAAKAVAVAKAKPATPANTKSPLADDDQNPVRNAENEG